MPPYPPPPPPPYGPGVGSPPHHHLPEPEPFREGWQWEGVNTFSVFVPMASVTIPMDATDEEEQRIKEEAYTRHLTTERAEADREMNAEYAATATAQRQESPPGGQEARQAERAAMEERWRRDFPWAPVLAPVSTSLATRRTTWTTTAGTTRRRRHWHAGRGFYFF